MQLKISFIFFPRGNVNVIIRLITPMVKFHDQFWKNISMVNFFLKSIFFNFSDKLKESFKQSFTVLTFEIRNRIKVSKHNYEYVTLHSWCLILSLFISISNFSNEAKIVRFKVFLFFLFFHEKIRLFFSFKNHPVIY